MEYPRALLFTAWLGPTGITRHFVPLIGRSPGPTPDLPTQACLSTWSPGWLAGMAPGHWSLQGLAESNGVRPPQSEPLLRLCDFMKTTQPIWALVPYQWKEKIILFCRASSSLGTAGEVQGPTGLSGAHAHLLVSFKLRRKKTNFQDQRKCLKYFITSEKKINILGPI